MNKVGIICDLKYSRHHLFQSYFHAVENLFGLPRVVKSVDQLYGVELLFIGDDHYSEHKKIWQNNAFIEYCNTHHIKVVALTNEKILNSYFPWNADNLKALKRFHHLHHFAIDVDDCTELGIGLNRTAPSKFFKSLIPTSKSKLDKIDRKIYRWLIIRKIGLKETQSI